MLQHHDVLEIALSGINAQLKTVISNQNEMMEKLMSTGNTITDLNNQQTSIAAAVQAATAELTQLVNDVNAALAALRSQQGPVTQAQLDAVVNQNTTILTALTALNSAMTTEDTTVNPPAPTPAPTPEPTPAPPASE